MNLDEVASLDLVPQALTRPIPTNLRIGLVGAGRVVHSGVMPAYRSAGIMPLAASDPDPAARASLQALWGVPQMFADWREMLDSVELDVIDVNIRWDVGLSPLRVEIVERAAAAGIHVIMAKPLAETWDQCREMVDRAAAGGILLAVDQNTRYAPAFFGCRQLVRSGALGQLISASINYHSAIGRQHTNEFNAVHDVCVHGIDILLTWFAEEPTTVFGHWSRRVDNIGSVLAATLIFKSGANATILYDFATRHRRQFEFVAVGDLASADGLQDQDLPGPARMLRASLRYGPHNPRGLAVELPLSYALSPSSYLATRADLLQAINEKRSPWASGANVLATMRTLFALERSIGDGAVVEVGDMAGASHDRLGASRS